MSRFLATAAVFAATPALAATGPFFSLRNTDFVVLVSFLAFIGVLFYYKVPGLLGGLLDKRAQQIRNDLNEARALREEAQKLLASYERKVHEATEQSERIVQHARDEAVLAGEQAKVDLEAALERRLKAAEDQIASAEAAAVRDVRDRAIQVAVAAAGDAIAKTMTAEQASARIESAIKVVDAKLH